MIDMKLPKQKDLLRNKTFMLLDQIGLLRYETWYLQQKFDFQIN